MSESFSAFGLWQAASLTSPGLADATYKIQNSSTVKLVYCAPKSMDKKRTDVTGVQSDVNVHPDTGPAGLTVEIMLAIDRGAADQLSILTNLLRWYGTQNTNNVFKRGFLGLSSDDNNPLNVTPTATLGYKLIHAEQTNPVDYKSRQMFTILLQLGGRVLDMPIFGDEAE